MKWLLIDRYHMTYGPFSISKHPEPETVPLPYGLWFKGKQDALGYFRTSAEAMQMAAHIEATQI